MSNPIIRPADVAEHAQAAVRMSGGQPVDNPHEPWTAQHRLWQAAHDRALASDQLEGSAA